ncbi:G-alpha-domain-containing protein [Daedalea quercina L-15889]|uniref:G-alpha-domain-containing protein n=1 Tax=Daedalea quercina L-15889 TaxID=1314783 RepID=A0A165RL67_9APHY|nr:G-alpha-domain-containing protein [Daedalea quercina L-15889]
MFVSRRTDTDTLNHKTQMTNTWPPYPPPDETELEKAVRLEEEKVAKRISEEIDRQIESDRQELKSRRLKTKILLLGQAESGKSTLLKNFQIHFAPKAFNTEVEAWRAVIQLNLVRSVNVILAYLSKTSAAAAAASPRFSKPKDDLRWLKMRLAPLRQVEVILNRLLGVHGDDSPGESPVEVEMHWDSDKLSEVAVGSDFGWKTLMRTEKPRPTSRFWDDLDDARRILEACRDDIVAMCEDKTVQHVLDEEGIRILDEPGFFFDQASRICAMDYTPTAEDILRARLRTAGVEEHRLCMESPPSERGREWIFYDVGGARGQRAAWAAYFEDVSAVMFLCPISGFDQVLGEDRTTNRLVDSLKLWKTICSSKLLENATFIVFMNKSDILEKKLKAGIRFAAHIEQYKDQPNDLEHVSMYIRRILLAIYKECSPKKRPIHAHMTCATVGYASSFSLTLTCFAQLFRTRQDTQMMSRVLCSVRDIILMKALETTQLIG